MFYFLKIYQKYAKNISDFFLDKQFYQKLKTVTIFFVSYNSFV